MDKIVCVRYNARIKAFTHPYKRCGIEVEDCLAFPSDVCVEQVQNYLLHMGIHATNVEIIRDVKECQRIKRKCKL